MADSLTCPRCGRTTYHPIDIREGYCGACHDWTSPPSRDWPAPSFEDTTSLAYWKRIRPPEHGDG